MHNEPLARIKAISSSNFSKVQNTVYSIIQEAQNTNSHHYIPPKAELDETWSLFRDYLKIPEL